MIELVPVILLLLGLLGSVWASYTLGYEDGKIDAALKRIKKAVDAEIEKSEREG